MEEIYMKIFQNMQKNIVKKRKLYYKKNLLYNVKTSKTFLRFGGNNTKKFTFPHFK